MRLNSYSSSDHAFDHRDFRRFFKQPKVGKLLSDENLIRACILFFLKNKKMNTKYYFEKKRIQCSESQH